jgi:anti-anti-sigma factor
MADDVEMIRTMTGIGASQRPAGEVVEQIGTLTVRSWRDGATARIALEGEVDLFTVPAVTAALRGAEASDAGAIVVDMSALDFMDSHGAAAIVDAHNRCGDRLALVRGPRGVHRIFELTALDRSLPFGDG